MPARVPAPARAAARRTPHVLIISASMGAGHVNVAAELARRLAETGASTDVVDVIEAAGRKGRQLHRTYRLLLSHAPFVYDAAMRFWARFPMPLERLTAVGGRQIEQALDAAVRATGPDVVVSTYNLASQALGRLAARGAVRMPVITLVTDPGAHPYWVSSAVALHIAPLPETAERLCGMGARRVVAAPPLVRPEIQPVPDRAAARRALGLPGRRTVVVSAGSWAAGRIQRTAATLARDPELSVVVLCGRDERLRRALAARADVCAVGWTTEVARYLAAADVVVDNAGGLTCWESLACGTPVVIFDPLPGHGRLNAIALHEAGVATFARDRLQLLDTVREPRPAPPLLCGPEPAERYVLALARRSVDAHA